MVFYGLYSWLMMFFKMKMYDGVVYLDSLKTFMPSMNAVHYTDVDGNRIVVPMDVLIRLYDGAKYHIEKVYGINFDEFCDDVLDSNHQFGQ